MTLVSQLNLPSTASLATIQAAVNEIADPTRRACLQNLLTKLVASEQQPLEGWRQ
jgi:hypothetical protein